MLKPDTRISIADLAAVGITLRPMDAVAIVRELVLQVIRGVIPGVPSLHVIRIAPSGALQVEGPVAAGSRSISRAAQLLETLLPPFDSATEVRVPGALRLALARAMGTLDLPPYPSLEAFAETLRRFSPVDTPKAMRDLVSRWAEAAELAAELPPDESLSEEPAIVSGDPSPITISDIRRARRATGLPLSEIAERSRIPVDLLRQLEWGYIRNWPVGLYGRTQLVRYARASGLDEQLVIETVRPMLEAVAVLRPEAVAELRPEAVAELRPEAVAELKPEAVAELKSDRRVAATTNVEPVGVAEAKTETTTLQPAEVKPEAVAELKPEAAAELKPERGQPGLAAGLAEVADEPIAAVEEPAPALRLGLEDFPAEAESERAAPRTIVAEPEPVTALEVVVAEHALVWEPEIRRTRELVRLPRPRRRRGTRIAGWLGAAAVLGLAMTPLVQDRLLRDREQQLTAIRSTVDRISSAIPPIRRAPLPLEPAPTVPAAAERSERASDAPEAPDTPAAPQPKPAPVRTTIDDAVAQSPSFATTGSAAFYRNPGDADGALMPAGDRSDGSVLRITRVVDDHAKNYHARPSPDGQQIAFDSDRDGERGIYVANVDGTNVKRVSGPGYGAIPSWSPDGTRLAFVRVEQDQPQVWNLWTVELATGELHRLTSRKSGQPWGGSWFPDGNRIAYSVDDQLVIHDLETGREKTFASPRRGQMVRTPAVSPDGRRVIFQIFRDGAWLLDLGDGSMRKVLADPTAEDTPGRRTADAWRITAGDPGSGASG